MTMGINEGTKGNFKNLSHLGSEWLQNPAGDGSGNRSELLGQAFTLLGQKYLPLSSVGIRHLDCDEAAALQPSRLAGALFTTQFGFVSPPLLGFALSTEVLIWVAVGGRGVLLGALLGAVLVWSVENALSDH